MMLNNALLHWLLLHNEPKGDNAGGSQVSMGKWDFGAVHWEEDAWLPP